MATRTGWAVIVVVPKAWSIVIGYCAATVDGASAGELEVVGAELVGAELGDEPQADKAKAVVATVAAMAKRGRERMRQLLTFW
ncbi:MAG: hypothetical protein LBD97_01885 [Bifidobacteriaceae bacterium]|nr:hypothetical protein [Bifidobacteriaceae bacterium]